MSTNRNTVQLVGIAASTEHREIAKGRHVARISLAVIDHNRDGEVPEYHTCIAWGDLAQRVTAEVKSGQRVKITGRLVHRSYVSKAAEAFRSEERRMVTEIVLSDFTANYPHP